MSYYAIHFLPGVTSCRIVKEKGKNKMPRERCRITKKERIWRYQWKRAARSKKEVIKKTWERKKEKNNKEDDEDKKEVRNSLVGCVLRHINPCSLFYAKSCSYIHTGVRAHTHIYIICKGILFKYYEFAQS